MNDIVYKKRRDRLLEMLDDGVGVIVSAEQKTRSNDTEYPYRQASDFYYLSGFEEDNSVLLFIKSAKVSKALLFVQPKDEAMELWTGRRLGVDTARKRFDVDEVHGIERYEEMLKEALKERTHLYLDLFSDDLRYAVAKGHCKSLVDDRSSKKSPRHYIDVSEKIRTMRLLKDEHEITSIRSALAITEMAHHDAMRQARPGMKEYSIQAAIEYQFKHNGAYSDAYTTIVAGGNNANTLHYISNRDTLEEGVLVLIDAGCEYAMYASDITRTFPVSGTFSPAQRALYEMILDVQLRIIAEIRPGIVKKYLQERSELWLCEGLVGLGVMHGEPTALIEAKRHKKYFPHGIGHWMGMDVHDPCPYVDEEGEELFFQAGMILTIEPGIYIREDDTDVPERYRGIGIRIEDNILVTETGYENLSDGIAKTVDEIEAMCIS